MSEDVFASGVALARLPGFTIDEPNLHLSNLRLHDVHLEDAVWGDLHVDELVADLLRFVPLRHLSGGGDDGVAVEHFADLRLHDALHDGDREL